MDNLSALSRWVPQVRGERFVVSPGVWLHPEISVSVPLGYAESGGAVADDDPAVTIDLDYEHHPGRYRVARLEVDARNTAHEVSGATLRTIKVQHLVQHAVREALTYTVAPALDLLEEIPLGDGEETLWTAADRGDLLTCVALVYRVAEISNDNPAAAVARLFEWQQRTATNWIARARDEGYMSVTNDPAVVERTVDRVARAVAHAHEVRQRRKEKDGG